MRPTMRSCEPNCRLALVVVSLGLMSTRNARPQALDCRLVKITTQVVVTGRYDST